MRRVREEGFTIGIATDGDADRIGAVMKRDSSWIPTDLLAPPEIPGGTEGNEG